MGPVNKVWPGNEEGPGNTMGPANNVGPENIVPFTKQLHIRAHAVNFSQYDVKSRYASSPIRQMYSIFDKY